MHPPEIINTIGGIFNDPSVREFYAAMVALRFFQGQKGPLRQIIFKKASLEAVHKKQEKLYKKKPVIALARRTITEFAIKPAAVTGLALVANDSWTKMVELHGQLTTADQQMEFYKGLTAGVLVLAYIASAAGNVIWPEQAKKVKSILEAPRNFASNLFETLELWSEGKTRTTVNDWSAKPGSSNHTTVTTNSGGSEIRTLSKILNVLKKI